MPFLLPPAPRVVEQKSVTALLETFPCPSVFYKQNPEPLGGPQDISVTPPCSLYWSPTGFFRFSSNHFLAKALTLPSTWTTLPHWGLTRAASPPSGLTFSVTPSQKPSLVSLTCLFSCQQGSQSDFFFFFLLNLFIVSPLGREIHKERDLVYKSL